jgi:DNA mismatch endonuclease (patch repair protein)
MGTYYIRDGRAPIPKSESTSRVMSANRAKNTKPEIALRKALCERGLRGYRLHLKTIPGRPDIAFTAKRVAVFVNGCFWHRCPLCKPRPPKSNVDFWKNKFDRNIERDKRKEQELRAAGWEVLVTWECEIREKLLQVVNRIESTLTNRHRDD